ncbi:hypothetical protein ID866_3829 [Astraeus odoratus]|nr:hypothetical protein ID866_3829 [Astraeus odoratus]
MSVVTTELVKHGWVLPSTQTFFPYVTLFTVYTPYTIYRYGFMGWTKLIVRDGWKCLYFHGIMHSTQFNILPDLGLIFLDFEGGFLYVKVGTANPRCRRGTNALEEVFVRKSPLYEVLGQMGMWGMIVSGTQAAILEHKEWSSATWNTTTLAMLAGYSISVPIGYTLQMVFFRLASSPYFNMSLLTSDFYSLLFGLLLFHYKPYWLYFIAFTVVITGLIIYFCHARPEDQGHNDIQPPKYISRNEQTDDGAA